MFSNSWREGNSHHNDRSGEGRVFTLLAAFRRAITGEEVAVGGFRRGETLHLRNVSLGIRFAGPHRTHARFSRKTGEQAESLAHALEDDLAGLAVGPRVAGDFIDPLAVALQIEQACLDQRIVRGTALLRDDDRTARVMRVEFDQMAVLVSVGQVAHW